MQQSFYTLIYDGNCQLCLNAVKRLKSVDVFGKLSYSDLHSVSNLHELHPSLDREKALRQLHLITPKGKIFGGFYAFRRLTWLIPMYWPLLLFVYLPFASLLGTRIYQWIAFRRNSKP